MKLSEIVAYLNHLDQDDLQPDFDKILSHASSVLYSINDKNLQIGNFSSDLQYDFEGIEASISKFQGTISDLKAELRSLVKELEPEYYATSQQLYEDELSWEVKDYILQRKLSISAEQRNNILNRIKLFTDWRFPGIILRPGLENFIESLVPLDPLYLIDQHEELLQPSVTQFDPVYQNRLRQYVINDRQTGKIFPTLPDHQFGFIFAYNYFNYRPLTLIFKYLEECYAKLRPGGRLIFTYNDCDFSQGVNLAERNFMCYTPGRRIRNQVEDIGYEIKFNQTNPANAAWLELQKPGELESIRGGQTLAKIIPK